jgi:predicted amidophosphoribosyltransferase
MLDKLISLISPHHCVVCSDIADGMCKKCMLQLKPFNLHNCILCGYGLNTGSRCCSSCELANVNQLITVKMSKDLRKLLHEYKYNNKRAFCKVLAQIVSNNIDNTGRNYIIVPLPTSSKHRRQRGYDHIFNIVRHLSKMTNCEYEMVLKRKTNFRQVGADRQTRFIQAENAFISRYPLSPDRTYIIFDDVITTGATITSAVRALRSGGARKIQILAITHRALEVG